MYVALLCLLCHSLIWAEVLTAPQDRYGDNWAPLKEHKGLHPYICETGYRELADHVIDANNLSFDPSKVKLGDSLYVGVWLLDWFIAEVHDKIPYPYVLITCDVGSYLPTLNLLKLLYDPKVAFWFAKNMIFTNHSKLFPLPMGQFYNLWTQAVTPFIPTLNEIIASGPHPKDYLLYLNYTERDHGRRIEVANLFDKPYCFNRNRPERRPTQFTEYWDEVSRSKFVVSPLGLEVDCTRTWECFALGAIPIVEHSFLDPVYQDLPILLIHDWNEVNEAFLHKKYEEMGQLTYNYEKAFIDYWRDLINKKQEEIRRGDYPKETGKFSKQDLDTFISILKEQKKAKTPLIYRGNFTCLRPFQVAQALPFLPSIALYDTWTKHGMDYLKKFNPESKKLLRQQRVTLCSRLPTDLHSESYFLDLTHFRHSLFVELSELDNFNHSLERDIRHIYERLSKGALLFGNHADDPYVQEVLEKLQTMKITKKNNFWYSIK